MKKNEAIKAVLATKVVSSELIQALVKKDIESLASNGSIESCGGTNCHIFVDAS
ncbi:Hypothetical protein A7982_08186 [Minicystis rosea]|nr:Hypothetical protein A7982_08186 [Minicystis rosea]